MRKWKTVRNVTLAILIVFVVLIGIIGLGFAVDDVAYPDHSTGLTRLEAFGMVNGVVFAFSRPPLLADLLLLIVSLIKLRGRKA